MDNLFDKVGARFRQKSRVELKPVDDDYFNNLGFLLPNISDAVIEAKLAKRVPIRELLRFSLNPSALHRILLNQFYSDLNSYSGQENWQAPIITQLAMNLGIQGYGDDFSDEESDGEADDDELTVRARSVMFSRQSSLISQGKVTESQGIHWINVIYGVGRDPEKASEFFQLLIQQNLIELVASGKIGRYSQFCSPVELLRRGWGLKVLSELFLAHVLSTAVEVLHDCYSDEFWNIFRELVVIGGENTKVNSAQDAKIEAFLRCVTIDPNTLKEDSISLGELYDYCVNRYPERRLYFFKQLVLVHRFTFPVQHNASMQQEFGHLDLVLKSMFFPASLSEEELTQCSHIATDAQSTVSSLVPRQVLSMAVEVLHDTNKPAFVALFGQFDMDQQLVEVEKRQRNKQIAIYFRQKKLGLDPRLDSDVRLADMYQYGVVEHPNYRADFFKYLVQQQYDVFARASREVEQFRRALLSAKAKVENFTKEQQRECEISAARVAGVVVMMNNLLRLGVPRQQLITHYINTKMMLQSRAKRQDLKEQTGVSDPEQFYKKAQVEAWVMLDYASDVRLAQINDVGSTHRRGSRVATVRGLSLLGNMLQALRAERHVAFLRQFTLSDDASVTTDMQERIYRAISSLLNMLSKFSGSQSELLAILSENGIVAAEDIDYFLLVQQAVDVAKTLRQQHFPLAISALEVLLFSEMTKGEIKSLLEGRIFSADFSSAENVEKFITAFNAMEQNPLSKDLKPEFSMNDVAHLQRWRDEVTGCLRGEIGKPIRRDSKAELSERDVAINGVRGVLHLLPNAAIYFLDMTMLEAMAQVELAKQRFKREQIGDTSLISNPISKAVELKIPLVELLSYGAGEVFHNAAHFGNDYESEKRLFPEQLGYKNRMYGCEETSFDKVQLLLKLEMLLLKNQEAMVTDLVAVVAQARSLVIGNGVDSKHVETECHELIGYLTGIEYLPGVQSSLIKSVITAQDRCVIASLLLVFYENNENNDLFSYEFLEKINEIGEALQFEKRLEKAKTDLDSAENNLSVIATSLNELTHRYQSNHSDYQELLANPDKTHQELARQAEYVDFLPQQERELERLKQELDAKKSLRETAISTHRALAKELGDAKYHTLMRELICHLRGYNELPPNIYRLVRMLENVVIYHQHQLQQDDHQNIFRKTIHNITKRAVSSSMLYAPGRNVHLFDNLFKGMNHEIERYEAEMSSVGQEVKNHSLLSSLFNRVGNQSDNRWEFLPNFLIDATNLVVNYLETFLGKVYANFKDPSSYGDVVLVNERMHFNFILKEVRRCFDAYVEQKSGVSARNIHQVKSQWDGILLLRHALIDPFFDSLEEALEYIDIDRLISLCRRGVNFSDYNSVIDCVVKAPSVGEFKARFGLLMDYLMNYRGSNLFDRVSVLLCMITRVVDPMIMEKDWEKIAVVFLNEAFLDFFLGEGIERLGFDDRVTVGLIESSLKFPSETLDEAVAFFSQQSSEKNFNYKSVAHACPELDFFKQFLVMKLVEPSVVSGTYFEKELNRFKSSYLFNIIPTLSSCEVFSLLDYVINCFDSSSVDSNEYFLQIQPQLFSIYQKLHVAYSSEEPIPYSVLHHSRNETIKDVLCDKLGDGIDISRWCDELLLYAAEDLFLVDSGTRLKQDCLAILNASTTFLFAHGSLRLHDYLIAQRKLDAYPGSRASNEFFVLLGAKFPLENFGSILIYLAGIVGEYRSLPSRNKHSEKKQLVERWDMLMGCLLAVRVGSDQHIQISEGFFGRYQRVKDLVESNQSLVLEKDAQPIELLLGAFSSVMPSLRTGKQAAPEADDMESSDTRASFFRRAKDSFAKNFKPRSMSVPGPGST